LSPAQSGRSGQGAGDKLLPYELLEGKALQLPEGRVDVTFKKAPRAKRARQNGIGL